MTVDDVINTKSEPPGKFLVVSWGFFGFQSEPGYLELLTVLGTTPRIVSDNSEVFAAQIKQYTGPKCYWPLIRQIKVWCRSPALATGVILVDLPGVSDSNAARNAVAQDYIKDCNYLWIAAPISRAINDKVAKGAVPLYKMTFIYNNKVDALIIILIRSAWRCI